MNYQISTDSGARLRIDKWLWAARFFKTRSLASDAVEKGRVRIGGANVKPSKDVRVGDLVEIEIEHVLWQVNVLGICEVRGPAPIAQTLYAETDSGRQKRVAESERRQPRCRVAQRSATAALSTNFQARTEKVFHGGRDAAVLRSVVVDRTGHTNGRGAANEYQRDDRNSKGQFHWAPPVTTQQL
jgi:ribosome-associated heat shock protein Hsp15